MKYCHEFFRNRDEAMRFQSKNGGVLYTKPIKRPVSRYHDEAHMAGMTQEEMQKKPFCIAWNENDEEDD